LDDDQDGGWVSKTVVVVVFSFAWVTERAAGLQIFPKLYLLEAIR